jgi:hypothetical protein
MSEPSDPSGYVAAVLALYVDMPETPLRAGVSDHWLARRFHDDGVPLRVVETALLLASLRRLIRPPDLPPLPPVRLVGLLPRRSRRTPVESCEQHLSRLPPA